MAQVLLCPECRKPVSLRQKYVVTNRGTARAKHQRIYAHLGCVEGKASGLSVMSDMKARERLWRMFQHRIAQLDDE
jgi:hypothetical protein